MPIGSTVVYNSGDLILSTVSSSGVTFQENKIAAATSSIILFNSNGLISSQSLNSTTVGTASSLVAANSYTASNLQVTSTLLVGSISASSFIIAPSFTGSLAGTSSWATNALTAALATSINFTASNSTTSQTASYLTTTNSYTVANLTASNISASGTGSFGCVGIGTTSPGSKLEVSGQISVAAGSEPSPAYAFASDLDTGFYRPAADQLRIVTGGASRASFTSTEIRVGNNLGNLDIGAESKFIIVGSENTPTLNTLIASLGFSNASNQAGQTSDEIAKILVTCQDATTNQGRLEFQTKDGTNLLTRMMIDKNGNVGVGTSSPNTLLNVGSGTPSTAANGIQFGSDTSANLYRISTGVIKTDGGLTVGGTTTTVNALSASGINVNGNVRASSFTGSVFGTSSWSTNALTASFVTLAQSASYYGGSVTSASYALSSSFATNAANAFIQNGNSFGATATIGTNDANSLVLETNNTAQLTINSGGRIGIGVGVDPACKLNISDTHVGSLGSASIFISTTQNQNTATSGNDVGIYNIYTVANFTSSTSVQNQAIYNSLQINGSGSFSGSYRAARHGVLLSNSASLEANSFLANTYLTNQIIPGIPNFNIPNWYLGTYIYSDLITGNTTGSIGSTYGHYLGTPFSTGAGGITVTSSYGIYIERQKTANVVTNGYGIYQNYTGDLNIFAGKTRIGSTTAPINTLDVTGNISASTITASLFFGTSSVANALNTANSYQIANLTASNISASSFTGSFSGSINNAVSASFANTASSLVVGNNYTVTNLTSTGTATFATASFTGDLTIPHFDYGNNTGIWVQIDELLQGSTYTGYSERMIVNVYGGAYHEAGMTQYIIKARSGISVYKSDVNGGVAGHTLKIYQTGSSAATASADCFLIGIRMTSGSYYSVQGTAYETQNGKYCKWTTTTETGSGVWTDTNFTSSTFYNDSTSSWATNSLTASSLVQSNSYRITNLTASNISASTITASNMIVNGNLTVTGSIFASLFSASNIYITSSTLVVTDNIITINALSPYQRYAGLDMYDSGSGTLSSFLWDSINNYFFVSSSDAGASRQIILGPTGESSLTANYIPLISGSNNITSSVIYQSGSNVGIGTTSPDGKLSVIQSNTYSSFRSNSSSAYTFLSIGRSSSEFELGVAGGANQFFSGTAAGESILKSFGGKLHLGYGSAAPSITIDLTNNVGIGTTTPLSKFVVNGGTVNTSSYTTSEARIVDGSIHLMKTVAGGVFESIRAMNMDTTAGTTVRVLAASTSDPFNNANGGKVFIDAIRTSTNMDLAFSLNDVAGAAAVERVRFMGSGNVGIGSTSPVNKLDVVGNISCSVITASLFFGTASVSNALNSANSYQVTNLTTSGDIIYGNAVLLDYSSSVLATSQSNYVVLKNLTGSYNGAFFDYFASSASNFRAGTVIAGWSGSNITYTEYATTDVGGTNQLTMSAAISASYIQLLGNAASSLNWNIKSSGRYL